MTGDIIWPYSFLGTTKSKTVKQKVTHVTEISRYY